MASQAGNGAAAGAAGTVGVSVDDPTTPVPAGTRKRLETARVKDLGAATPRRLHVSAADVDDLDIPYRAYIAYRFAADVLERADTGCDLDWSVLAALGRIESDHGRYGGASVQDDGSVSPAIRGIALDGRHGTARIRDTDGGSLDGDARWDRAVGPLQFIPGTWSAVAVDADGDGVRNPDDIDDAAVAAAVYLCASGPLDTDERLRDAIYSYNHSASYVFTVLVLARQYAAHEYAELPSSSSSPSAVLAGGPISTVTPDPSMPTRWAEPTTSPGAQQSPHGNVGVGQSSDGGRPGATPGPTDTHQGSGPTPTQNPTPSDTPSPSDTPGPTPDPTPSPTPSPPPSPTPTPDPPVIVELTGLLTSCDGLWCLDGAVLDVGDETWLATTALADLDADGATETNAEELTGLADTTVVLGVQDGTDPAAVHTVNGLAYLAE